MPAFIALGLWQLQRADYKRQLQADWLQHQAMPAVDVATLTGDTAEVSNRRVHASGRYRYQQQILIEGRKHNGQRGYHVITPMLIPASGRYLLVNRGWTAEPPTGSPSPEARVSGRTSVPLPPALQLDFVPQAGQPWPYLTIAQYADWSGLDLYPFVLLSDAGADTGLVRHWPAPSFNPAMHTGYAIQWFAFALMALLIWLRLSLVDRDREEHH